MRNVYDFVEMEKPHDYARHLDKILSNYIAFARREKHPALKRMEPHEVSPRVRQEMDNVISNLRRKYKGHPNENARIEIGKVKGVVFDFHIVSRVHLGGKKTELGGYFPTYTLDELILPHWFK